MAKSKKKEAKPKELVEEKQSEDLVDYRLKNEKNWLSFFGKLAFFIIAFLLIVFTIMANMGGKSDTLKEMLEGVAGGFFGGRPAKIQTLNNLSFFPSIAADFDGLRILPYPEASEAVVSIGKVQVKVGFFDILLSTAKFKIFKIENFSIKKGTYTQRDFLAERIYIDHDIGKNAAYLKGVGLLGPYQWDMGLALDIFRDGIYHKYKLDNDTAIELNIADLKVNGSLKAEHQQYAHIENLEISSNDLMVKGSLTLAAVAPGIVNIRGQLGAQESGAAIDLDINVNVLKTPQKISGVVRLSGFKDGDIEGKTSFKALAERFVEVFVDENYGQDKASYLLSVLFVPDYDLTLEIKEAQYAPMDGSSSMEMKILKDAGNFFLSGIKGEASSIPIDVPDILLVKKGEADGYTALVTQGDINLDIYTLVQTGITASVFGEQSSGYCAAYDLVKTEDGAGWSAASLGLAADNPVSFKEADYKFVSGILLGRGTNDPCMPFITKE